MRTLLLVPVLVRVLPHVDGRGINWRRIWTLPPVGRIQHRIILDAAAAAVCISAVAAVVGGGGVTVAVVVVVFPHSWG